MANFSDLGRLLLIAGGAIVLLGLVLLLVGRVSFFGRLPGDISIQRGNTTFFFPIVTDKGFSPPQPQRLGAPRR